MAVLTSRVIGEIVGEKVFLSAGTNRKDGMDSDLSACIAPESNVIRRHLLRFRRPSALALFTHGLNFLEVFRPAFGGFLPATTTEGNGGPVFSCHAERLQKPLAVCQIKARESTKYVEILRLAYANSDMADFDTAHRMLGRDNRDGKNVD